MIESLRDVSALAVTKPHGSRIRYLGGCHCTPCRAANSRYEGHRALERLKGNGNGFVGTTPVRMHLVKLSGLGVGYKQVAKVAKVNAGMLLKIRNGKRDNIRAQAARRVLEVTPQHKAPSATVPAEMTWQRLDLLLEMGFTKCELAIKLGSTSKTPALQIRRDRVLIRTERLVKRLYDYYR